MESETHMKRTELALTTFIFAAAILLTAFLATASVRAAGGGEQLKPPATPAGLNAQQTRGKYLVDIMGCHDCHTPRKMGPKGPEWDWIARSAAIPKSMTMPPAPAVPTPWVAVDRGAR